MFKPRSSYELALVRGVICITDLDEGGPSVTNDAEAVIEDLARRRNTLRGTFGSERRVIYRDSMGRWDELVHRDGKFVGFRPIGESDLQSALDKILGKGQRA